MEKREEERSTVGIAIEKTMNDQSELPKDSEKERVG